MDYKAFSLEVKDLEDSGLFFGYASTYDVDLQNDVVMPGAFSRTLKQKPDVPILWCHRMDSPIGVCQDAREDRRGLAVTGQLVLSVPLAAQARDLMKAGAVKGLSIGYSVPAGGWKDRHDGVRELHDVDLLEWSLVPLPANPHALVTQPPKSLRDWHDVFRGMGFSKRETDRLVHAVKSVINDPEPDPNDLVAFLLRR